MIFKNQAILGVEINTDKKNINQRYKCKYY